MGLGPQRSVRNRSVSPTSSASNLENKVFKQKLPQSKNTKIENLASFWQTSKKEQPVCNKWSQSGQSLTVAEKDSRCVAERPCVAKAEPRLQNWPTVSETQTLPNKK